MAKTRHYLGKLAHVVDHHRNQQENTAATENLDALDDYLQNTSDLSKFITKKDVNNSASIRKNDSVHQRIGERKTRSEPIEYTTNTIGKALKSK